jgi:Methyltransferase domain
VALPRQARIVELGCGKADLLIRLLRVHPDATAEGFDRNPWFLADARAAATVAGVVGRLSLIETDAPAVRLAGRAVDAAIAMGATGIVGDGRATVTFLASIVVPGGEVVFGDGFWAATPPDDGLAAFGMTRGELPDGLDGFAALGSAAGLEPVAIEAVSTAEWDDYEAAYGAAVRTWAEAHPDDPDLDAFLARAEGMRTSYAAWRRRALGFAIGRFRRP